MRTPRLFVEVALSTGSAIDLPVSQSHYLRNVLRGREGQDIILFNGEGGEYRGVITAISRSVVTAQLDVFEPEDRESPLAVHLGLAITKRDAMDEAIQKSTELGAASITPVITEFNATSNKSLDKRQQHWQGVIRSAAEQCERNRLPLLHEITRFADFIEATGGDIKLIAHPGGNTDFADVQTPASVILLVGPEGGFSEDEVRTAVDADYYCVGLGPRILRAETAPLALISLLQSRWGDWPSF